MSGISKRADTGENSAHMLALTVVHVRYLLIQSYECLENKNSRSVAFFIAASDTTPSCLSSIQRLGERTCFLIGCSDFTLIFRSDIWRCSSKVVVPELETLSVLRVFVSLAVVCCPMRQDPSLVTSSNTPERHTHAHSLKISTGVLHCFFLPSACALFFPPLFV